MNEDSVAEPLLTRAQIVCIVLDGEDRKKRTDVSLMFGLEGETKYRRHNLVKMANNILWLLVCVLLCILSSGGTQDPATRQPENLGQSRERIKQPWSSVDFTELITSKRHRRRIVALEADLAYDWYQSSFAAPRRWRCGSSI